MSQQDQSPAGLPIKISHQSTGGADLQVSGTRESQERAVPPLSPLYQPLHYHGVVLLSPFRNEEGFFSSFLPPCP